MKVSQKEKDERGEKEKEAKQKRRKHWEESKQKGSGGKGAAKKAVRLALDARTLRCAFCLSSLKLDLIPGQAMMARGQLRIILLGFWPRKKKPQYFTRPPK